VHSQRAGSRSGLGCGALVALASVTALGFFPACGDRGGSVKGGGAGHSASGGAAPTGGGGRAAGTGGAQPSASGGTTAAGGAGPSASGGIPGVAGGAGATPTSSGGGAGTSAHGGATASGGTAGGPSSGSGGAAGGSGGAGSGGAPVTCTGPDLNIVTAQIAGTMKVAGKTVTAMGTDPGWLYLQPKGGGDAQVASIADGSYKTRVIAGTYDVFFMGLTPLLDPQLPVNGLALITKDVKIGGAGTSTVNLDVPTGLVAGVFKLNGAPTPLLDSGHIYLSSASGNGASIKAGETSGAFSVRVVPDTYDLYYGGGISSTSSSVPLTPSVRLASAITVTSGGTTTVDADVPMVKVRGAITINGVAGPVSGSGEVRLRSALGGPDFLLASNTVGTFIQPVVPGTYDVVYGQVSKGTAVPINRSGIVMKGVVIPAGTTATLNVDVPAVTVSGALTMNGASVAGTSGMGLVQLSTPEGDLVTLGSLSSGTYSALVVPGTYDIYYSGAGASAAAAPRNTKVLLKSAVVVPAAGATLSIDVPSAMVTGALTINGAVVSNPGDEGQVFLRGPSGDATLGLTSAGTYAIPVVPGTYDVFYKATTASAMAPSNTSALLKTGVVVAATGKTTLNIDVPSVAAAGTIKIDGATVTDMLDFGNLALRGAATGDEIALGPTYAGAYATRVVPGTYDVVYTVFDNKDRAPINHHTVFTCLTVK